MNFLRLVGFLVSSGFFSDTFHVDVGAQNVPPPAKGIPCADPKLPVAWCQMDVYRKENKNHHLMGTKEGSKSKGPYTCTEIGYNVACCKTAFKPGKHDISTLTDLKNGCVDPRNHNFQE
ncbi:hypothetical protein PGT21_031810 [Puccinia graminis f. sp. tritici]|nr:hypothetical protein PGT21_031810 [Puccinia graminis f. sp. tritici]KAA1139146.1 hypothetical protein PGTUg99_036631 [Puccinia graminis f. sp. tritici]